jgi:hypothetical protein
MNLYILVNANNDWLKSVISLFLSIKTNQDRLHAIAADGKREVGVLSVVFPLTWLKIF